MSNPREDYVSSLLHEAVPEPPRDIAVADIARQVKVRRTRLIATPITVVALIVLIAGVTLIARQGPSRRTSAGPRPAAAASTQFPDGLVLSHPATWRYVRDDAASYGPIRGLGYLTNEPAVTQCVTHTTQSRVKVTCRPPVTRMGPGDVYVAVFELGSTTGSLMAHPSRQLAGFPASVTDTTDPPQACPTGAIRAITSIIDLSTEQSTTTSGVEILVCLSADAADTTARAARRMLDTAQMQLAGATAAPLYLGPISVARDFGGEVTAQPPGETAPRLSWGQALAICARSGCTRGHPQIVLARATTPTRGYPRSGGGINPTYNRTLSYIITSKAPCGLGAGKSEPTPPPSCVSTTLWLVNADTGDHSFGANY